MQEAENARNRYLQLKNGQMSVVLNQAALRQGETVVSLTGISQETLTKNQKKKLREKRKKEKERAEAALSSGISLGLLQYGQYKQQEMQRVVKDGGLLLRELGL